MMNAEKAVIFENLAQNKEFLQAVAAATGKDELQSIFARFGLELTREEIDGIVKMLNASVGDELGADDLDQVNGGSIEAVTVFEWAWKGIKAVSKTAWNWGRKLAEWEKGL